MDLYSFLNKFQTQKVNLRMAWNKSKHLVLYNKRNLVVFWLDFYYKQHNGMTSFKI